MAEIIMANFAFKILPINDQITEMYYFVETLTKLTDKVKNSIWRNMHVSEGEYTWSNDTNTASLQMTIIVLVVVS